MFATSKDNNQLFFGVAKDYVVALAHVINLEKMSKNLEIYIKTLRFFRECHIYDIKMKKTQSKDY